MYNFFWYENCRELEFNETLQKFGYCWGRLKESHPNVFERSNSCIELT